MTYVVAYDIGTTGVKTCLFGLGERIELLASAQAGYGLRLLEGGGAEQDPEAWGGGASFTLLGTAPVARRHRSSLNTLAPAILGP